MKKTLLIINITFLILIVFLIYRNVSLNHQKNNNDISHNRNIIIIDSLIKEKFIFITTHYLTYFNEDAKKIILNGNQLIEDINPNNKKYKEYYDFCMFYNKENYLTYNSNYTIFDIKLLQLITLENISKWQEPYYQFDSYRIIAIEEEMKQSNDPQNLRLWFDYAQRTLYENSKDYVTLVYNNDTITKKDLYFNIKYVPKEKGQHFIPVKVLFANKPFERDYTIYVNVK